MVVIRRRTRTVTIPSVATDPAIDRLVIAATGSAAAIAGITGYPAASNNGKYLILAATDKDYLVLSNGTIWTAQADPTTEGYECFLELNEGSQFQGQVSWHIATQRWTSASLTASPTALPDLDFDNTGTGLAATKGEAAIIELASKLSSITGQVLTPVSANFAGLPTADVEGNPANNGDVGVVSPSEVGTGTTENPQYPAGLYLYTGAAYDPTPIITFTETGVFTEAQITSTSGADYSVPRLPSPELLDAWGRSRRMRRVFNTSTSFDFTALGYPDRTAVFVRNANTASGIGLTYGAGGTTNLEITFANSKSQSVTGQDSFNVQPGEIVVVEKDGTTVYASIFPAERVLAFTNYASANGFGAMPHDSIVVVRDTAEVWARRTGFNNRTFPVDGVENADWFKVGASKGEIANFLSTDADHNVAKLWSAETLEAWYNSKSTQAAEAWEATTNYVQGDIRSAAEPDADNADFGKVFNWFHVAPARQSGTVFDVAEKAFWQRMALDSTPDTWPTIDGSTGALWLGTFGVNYRLIGTGQKLAYPTAGGVNANKFSYIRNDSPNQWTWRHSGTNLYEAGSTAIVSGDVPIEPGETLLVISDGTDVYYSILGKSSSTPRRTYTANGAISNENQKAVFYSNTALAMTISSATDRQIVVIRSGPENVVITDSGGKLFRHKDPTDPAVILPDEASITLNTNATWTLDFDAALDRWVVSDGDTSGSSATLPASYSKVGDIHVVAFDANLVKVWGKTSGVNNIALPVTFADIQECEVHITIANGSNERFVQWNPTGSTNNNLAVYRGSVNTNVEFVWSVFGVTA